MRDKPTGYASIDAYIASFPVEIQKILSEIRAVIKAAAPLAEEKISYQMPTFFLYGNLVHFAAHKNHIGFYPAPSGIEEFEEELAPYFGGKGSIRFPLEKPIPYDLIARIVAYRVSENLEKAHSRRKREA